MTIDDLLAEHTPDVAELTRRLRDAIRAGHPVLSERVYPGWHGIGFHHPQAGYVCALFPADDRVRLGFEHGHLLADTDGLFDGDGEQVRYVTLTEWRPDLIESLTELIDEAIELRSNPGS
jgi:hypothetical protein